MATPVAVFGPALFRVSVKVMLSPALRFPLLSVSVKEEINLLRLRSETGSTGTATLAWSSSVGTLLPGVLSGSKLSDAPTWATLVYVPPA